MSNVPTHVTQELYAYMQSMLPEEHPVLSELRHHTANMSTAKMQISIEQGHFLAFLVHLISAKKCLEIGVFTGYSSLAVALQLPADGQLIACDVNEEFTNIAKKYWQKANVHHKIQLRLGPALASMKNLLETGYAGTIDFVFIDADKLAYGEYYEAALSLVRSGGLIVFDNVFLDGAVADPHNQGSSVQAMRVLNKKLATDVRVSISVVPMSDGITLVRKH